MQKPPRGQADSRLARTKRPNSQSFQAASGICTITATSSEDWQRGQRSPATTRARLPRKSSSAEPYGANRAEDCPDVWLSTSAFMTNSPQSIGRTGRAEGSETFVKILKSLPQDECYAEKTMTPAPPKIQLIQSPEYRENYANSVQVRVNLWTFFCCSAASAKRRRTTCHTQFSRHLRQPAAAKAVLNVLQQNVTSMKARSVKSSSSRRLAPAWCSSASERLVEVSSERDILESLDQAARARGRRRSCPPWWKTSPPSQARSRHTAAWRTVR